VLADNFFPSPEVNSAIIRLNMKETNKHKRNEINEKDFFRLAKIGFSSRRKMLKNNLANGYHISQAEAEERIVKAGFNSKIRAQELSVDAWRKLLNIWNY